MRANILVLPKSRWNLTNMNLNEDFTSNFLTRLFNFRFHHLSETPSDKSSNQKVFIGSSNFNINRMTSQFGFIKCVMLILACIKSAKMQPDAVLGHTWTTIRTSKMVPDTEAFWSQPSWSSQTQMYQAVLRVLLLIRILYSSQRFIWIKSLYYAQKYSWEKIIATRVLGFTLWSVRTARKFEIWKASHPPCTISTSSWKLRSPRQHMGFWPSNTSVRYDYVRILSSICPAKEYKG